MAGGTEVFISYFTIYSASILWGLYLKWFLFPAFCLVIVWHLFFYGLIIHATSTATERLSSAEYGFWLPLTYLAGIYVGCKMSRIWDFNRMLFIKDFDKYLCWVPIAFLNFVTFQAVLWIWDLDGRLDPPINYWVTFAIQLVLLVVWYFVNASFDVFWMYPRIDAKGQPYMSSDDNKLTKFTIAHAVLTVSTTVIFAIIRGVAPGFWPFWIFLITFGFHLILIAVSQRAAIKRTGKHAGPFYDTVSAVYDKVKNASAATLGVPEDAFHSKTRRVSERGGVGGSTMEMTPLTSAAAAASDPESGGMPKTL